MCHHLLIKKFVAMEIHLKVDIYVEDCLRRKKFRVNLGGHLSSESIVICSMPQGSVHGAFLFPIFINGYAEQLTCNRLFVLPLKTSKSKHLSIEGPPNFVLVFPDLAIIMN